jgi:hypothetical protein
MTLLDPSSCYGQVALTNILLIPIAIRVLSYLTKPESPMAFHSLSIYNICTLAASFVLHT